MPKIGEDRPLRVAVIGSGPAGVYAADALLRSGVPVRIDVLDRLPSPYGLVRYGVAPDHLKIKSVAGVFRKVLEHAAVRFFGNVAYGVDVTRDDLSRLYDAVVFATGSPHDRRLGVPGEDLPGSHAAADFVAWYSGLPSVPRDFPLDAREVAVIGAGNVALDVARVLAKGATGLAHTDVPDHVLATLRDSPVTDIHIIARRGPAQAKFTQVELRELGELPEADVVVRPEELILDAASEREVAARRQVRTIVELFREWSTRPLTGKPRRIHVRFLRRPVEIVGTDHVEALRLERSELDGSGRAVGTGDIETLPVQMVFRSIGYRGAPLDGLPFDEDAGTVPNDAGRVLDADGRPRPGEYVAGWIKRGPTGVIGTNKSDAAETVKALLEDAPKLPPAADPSPQALTALLDRRGVPYVTWDGWLRLDAHEIDLGRAQGRARIKVPDLATMLAVCRKL